MEILQFIKKRFLWLTLSVIAFYVVFILISDVEKISEVFWQIRAEFLVVIFSLGFLSHIVKSLRQKELLNELGENIPFKENVVIYMAGLSLINTPGGIGTFIKSIYLKKKFQVPTEKSISVIFMERYHDLLAGTSIVFVSVLIYFSSLSVSLLVISSAILVGIYVMIRSKKFSEYIHKKISKIKFISEKLPDSLPSDTFSVLTSTKNMTKGWMISICGWVIDSLAVYVAFLALNVDLGYILTSQIYFTSLGYGVLSFLPAGIVVNESIADFLLVRQGLELYVATSLVILTRLSTVWFATIIGIGFTRYASKHQKQI